MRRGVWRGSDVICGNLVYAGPLRWILMGGLRQRRILQVSTPSIFHLDRLAIATVRDLGEAAEKLIADLGALRGLAGAAGR